MMQVLERFPPIIALVLGLILLAWLVLVFLVPFMIESIRQSARKTHEELAEMNEKLDRLHAALLRATSAPESPRIDPLEVEARPQRAAEQTRQRLEPTISQTDVRHAPPRSRREPIVK